MSGYIYIYLGIFLAVFSSQAFGCCDKKTVGGINYTLVGETNMAPSDCLNNCSYTSDEENDPTKTYCFASGNLTVDCIQTLENANFVDGTGSSNVKPLGCYQDYGEPNRILPWGFFGKPKPFPQMNTPEFCISMCSVFKNTYYAGVSGGWCMCGANKPSSIHIIPDAECDASCPGDKTQTCGGPNKLNVYEVTA